MPVFIPCPILLSSLPFYGGGHTPIRGLFLYIDHVHPSQLLRRRLSMIADDAVVAGLLFVVELRSRIYDVHQVIGPIC